MNSSIKSSSSTSSTSSGKLNIFQQIFSTAKYNTEKSQRLPLNSSSSVSKCTDFNLSSSSSVSTSSSNSSSSSSSLSSSSAINSFCPSSSSSSSSSSTSSSKYNSSVKSSSFNYANNNSISHNSLSTMSPGKTWQLESKHDEIKRHYIRPVPNVFLNPNVNNFRSSIKCKHETCERKKESAIDWKMRK